MPIYQFFDWDPETEQEYDISGSDYAAFISVCFRYASVMSFMHCPTSSVPWDALEAFRIPRPDNIPTDNEIYGLGYLTDEQIGLQFYKICPALMELLLRHTNSVFEWIDGWGFHNPENPVFYRQDGSIFLSSLIHEGAITLTAADEEDISDLLLTDGWQKGIRTIDYDEIGKI